MVVGLRDPGPLPSPTETQQGEGEAAPRPHTSPRRCPGLASLRNTLRLTAALVTGITGQSGDGTAAQGGSRARAEHPPRSRGQRGPALAAPRQSMGRVRVAAPRGRALPGSASQPHGDPAPPRRGAPPSRGEAPGGCSVGDPSDPHLRHVALTTPGGPCPGRPGPGPLGTSLRPFPPARASGRGDLAPAGPGKPHSACPGRPRHGAPAPSLCPQLWALRGLPLPLSQKARVLGKAFWGSRQACGGHCCHRGQTGGAARAGLGPRRSRGVQGQSTGGPGPQGAVVGSRAPQQGQGLGKGSDPSCSQEGRTRERR